MKYLLIAVILTHPFTVFAGCLHDNQSYPEGTKIGGLVCDEDGEWKEIEDRNTEQS